MSAVLLFVIAIASFLFYGVVGQDKTWLLAPAFLLTYTTVTVALFRKALGTKDQARGASQTANLRQPVAALLWVLFVLCGVAMIPYAAVPFEAKQVTLFIGGVVGAYLVWGNELTTFKDNRVLLGVLIFVVMLTALYGLIVHFKCPDRVLWAERYAIYEGRLMSTYICPNHFAHLMQMLMPFCVALLFIPQAGIYLKLLSAYSFLAFLPPLYLTESRAGWLGGIAATGVVLCLMALRRSRKLFAFLIILVPLCSILLLVGGWKYSETFQRRMKPVVEFLQHQSEEGVGSEAKDFRPQTWMDTIDMIKEQPLIGFGPGNYHYTFPEFRTRFQGKRIITGHPHNEYLELMADYGLVGFGLFALAWCFGLIRILIASLKAEETRHAFIGFAFIGTAAGTMVHSFFDFQMHVYPNALVFALLAVLAWGPLAAQRVKVIRHSASGKRRANELSADGSELFAENPPTTNHQLTTRLRRAGAWLLAIGYLLGALFCLQIMGSSYIRALGDRAAEQASAITKHSALDTAHPAAKRFALAAKIDPQNWRAYKGMGTLLFGERYYSLEMDEKVRLAGQERSWYERTYEHNSKDPETLLALGKCLIFLGKNQGTRDSAPGTNVDEGTASVSSDGSGPRAADSASATTGSSLQTSKTQIDQGLDLLRKACCYRPFNDLYWWNLGVELRKVGKYKEALDVFNHTASIKRTRSTKKNIEWLTARLNASGDRREVLGVGNAEEETPLQTGTVISKEAEGEEWTILSPTNANVDRGLMDLLDKMGE